MLLRALCFMLYHCLKIWHLLLKALFFGSVVGPFSILLYVYRLSLFLGESYRLCKFLRQKKFLVILNWSTEQGMDGRLHFTQYQTFCSLSLTKVTTYQFGTTVSFECCLAVCMMWKHFYDFRYEKFIVCAVDPHALVAGAW